MNIREMRKKLKIKQKDLAEQVEVGVSTINQYEKGKRVPNAIMLKKIAIALECSVDDLLKDN